MSVFDLKAGQSGRITKINVQGAAAERLAALGFKCGASVCALSFCLFNTGVLVGVGATRVALRKKIAALVEVEE